MSSLMFYCLKVHISAIYEKWVTDGRTDKASYGDAWTHLKTSESEKDVQRCLLK